MLVKVTQIQELHQKAFCNGNDDIVSCATQVTATILEKQVEEFRMVLIEYSFLPPDEIKAKLNAKVAEYKLEIAELKKELQNKVAQ